MPKMRALAEIEDFLLLPHFGSCETCGVIVWRTIQRYFPNHRKLVVTRSIEDILDGYNRVYHFKGDDWSVMRGWLRKFAPDLDKISRLPNSLTVTFEELSRREVCAKVFEFCLSRPFDQEWWEQWADKKIEVQPSWLLSYMREHRDQIASFILACARVEQEDRACRSSAV